MRSRVGAVRASGGGGILGAVFEALFSLALAAEGGMGSRDGADGDEGTFFARLLLVEDRRRRGGMRGRSRSSSSSSRGLGRLHVSPRNRGAGLRDTAAPPCSRRSQGSLLLQSRELRRL